VAGTGDFIVPALPQFSNNTMNMMQCVLVTIIDDDDLEETETFTIQLISGSPTLVLDPSRTTATITIFDVDGKIVLPL
jgi:hypothetical protein